MKILDVDVQEEIDKVRTNAAETIASCEPFINAPGIRQLLGGYVERLEPLTAHNAVELFESPYEYATEVKDIIAGLTGAMIYIATPDKKPH
jgi:hypothetical protein